MADSSAPGAWARAASFSSQGLVSYTQLYSYTTALKIEKTSADQRLKSSKSIRGFPREAHRPRRAPTSIKSRARALKVKTAAFRDVILKECQKVFARTAQSSGARQRMVVLVSYREPVAKTISYVHQVCNKNFRGRSTP